MKTLILFLCLILILGFGLNIIGCNKTTNVGPYQSEGVITGYDPRLCPTPACGGLLITIKNDTTKNPPPYYHINSTLAQLGISESTRFPINVSLNWKRDTGVFGTYHYIIVSKIKVIY